MESNEKFIYVNAVNAANMPYQYIKPSGPSSTLNSKSFIKIDKSGNISTNPNMVVDGVLKTRGTAGTPGSILLSGGPSASPVWTLPGVFLRKLSATQYTVPAIMGNPHGTNYDMGTGYDMGYVTRYNIVLWGSRVPLAIVPIPKNTITSDMIVIVEVTLTCKLFYNNNEPIFYSKDQNTNINVSGEIGADSKTISLNIDQSMGTLNFMFTFSNVTSDSPFKLTLDSANNVYWRGIRFMGEWGAPQVKGSSSTDTIMISYYKKAPQSFSSAYVPNVNPMMGPILLEIY